MKTKTDKDITIKDFCKKFKEVPDFAQIKMIYGKKWMSELWQEDGMASENFAFVFCNTDRATPKQKEEFAIWCLKEMGHGYAENWLRREREKRTKGESKDHISLEYRCYYMLTDYYVRCETNGVDDDHAWSANDQAQGEIECRVKKHLLYVHPELFGTPKKSKIEKDVKPKPFTYKGFKFGLVEKDTNEYDEGKRYILKTDLDQYIDGEHYKDEILFKDLFYCFLQVDGRLSYLRKKTPTKKTTNVA